MKLSLLLVFTVSVAELLTSLASAEKSELYRLKDLIKAWSGVKIKIDERTNSILAGYLSRLPKLLIHKVNKFLGPLSGEERKSLSACGAALLQATHNLHVQNLELQPSPEVLQALSKLPKKVQQDIVDLNGRMAEIANLLLTCSQPKVAKEISAKMANAETDHAEFDESLKNLPRNLAWKFKLFVNFLTPEQKSSIYHCGKKVADDSSKPQNAEVAMLPQIPNTLPEKYRTVLGNYTYTVYTAMDVLLQCVKPRVAEKERSSSKGEAKASVELSPVVKHYLQHLPPFVGPKVERFFRSLHEKQVRSLTRCGKAVIFIGNMTHVHKGDLMPPQNVLVGLNKIPKEFQQIVMDYDGRMLDLVNVMLLCSHAKVIPKDTESNANSSEVDEAVLGEFLGKLPKNLAWRFKMFAKQQNDEQKFALYHCSRKFVGTAIYQVIAPVSMGCKIAQALMKVPEPDRPAVSNYSRTMDQAVDIVLNCLTPN